MLDLNTVLTDFISISGLTLEESKKQSNLIEISIDYIKTNLKPGVDIESNKKLLSMLVASIAYHKYILIKESLSSSSCVKLGDISINSSSESLIKTAEKLKKEFTSLASHLLLSPNFIFRHV
ncbi:MAG: hypothetical protein J6C55_01845 [Oscillospiraceae bacterium]|nr:hypothetical protein [Oscillospiraceae bacterium]